MSVGPYDEDSEYVEQDGFEGYESYEAEPETAPAEPRRRRGAVVALLLLTVLLAGLGGAGAFAYNEQRNPLYRSTAVLIIDQEPALTASRNDGVVSKLVRLRVKYADIVSTTTFATQVANALSLPPGQVHAALTAAAPQNSLLLAVTATTGDADRAKLIATVAADTLHDTLQQQQASIGVTGNGQVTLTVVSPARPGVKISPRQSRSVLLGIGVAVAVLVVGAALAGAVRRRG